jgi:hypothetical protein
MEQSDQGHLAAPLAGRALRALTIDAPLHTPGPWSWQASAAHGYRIRTTASTSNAQWGSGDVAVVFFAGNGRSTEQCKADARLIAAAPDLLRVAELVMSWLDEEPGAHKLSDAARAAIVKATGSAS